MEHHEPSPHEAGTRPGVSAPAYAPPYPPTVPPAQHLPKVPWFAGLLSLFPGMGNVYNGLYLRAVTFFLLIVLFIYLAAEEHPLFGFAVAFVWIFNVLDAYRQARLINHGYSAEPDLAELRRGQASVGEKLLSGGVLLVVGVLALLDRFFRIDLDWILELWPVLLIAVGGWLLWSAFAAHKKQSALEASDD